MNHDIYGLHGLGQSIPSVDPRMVFPAVTATTSPLSILPQFVDVLGRKIDKISLEQDWGSCIDKSFFNVAWGLQHMPIRKSFPNEIPPQTVAGPTGEGQHHCIPNVSRLYHGQCISIQAERSKSTLRLLKSVVDTLAKMQTCYDGLTGHLTDATVHPEKITQHLACIDFKCIYCSMRFPVQSFVAC